MKAIILQSRRAEGGPWGTVNRFVGENQSVAAMQDSQQPAAFARLRDHATDSGRRYGESGMLPGRQFRVVEIDHVHARAPS